MNSENFAKIYGQILDSSIASDYEARHLFMDLLLIANWKNGWVDMTQDAISRRLNIPLEKVEEGLNKLMMPDEFSRSKKEGGRRLVPIDADRPWGWVIVNYDEYRRIRDVEARRDYSRAWMAEKRASKKVPVVVEIPEGLKTPKFEAAWATWMQHQKERTKKVLGATAMLQQLKKCEGVGVARAIAMIEHSIAGNYQGLFEPGGNGASCVPPVPANETREQKMARIVRESAC